jgi:hypothetical protein
MRKFLITLLFLASTLMFAQDGRTKVNFYNQTDSNLRFMLNGNPVCTGDVIPNGFCTETVNPGAYTASATNGSQTTGGQSFDIAYGETFNYRVWNQSTQLNNTNPYLRAVSLREYNGGFTVDVPVTLTQGATTPGTTNNGIAYTQTIYSAAMPNTDIYMVAVGNYPFALVVADNNNGIEGFRAAVKGTVVSQEVVTVSGQPALAAVISAMDGKEEIRFGVLLTFRGNTGYIFAFASYLNVTTTDVAAMKQFFNSASIN